MFPRNDTREVVKTFLNLAKDKCCEYKKIRGSVHVNLVSGGFKVGTRDASPLSVQNVHAVFTACKGSCKKVMFLHLSVSHSVNRVSQHPMGRGWGCVCLGGVCPGWGGLPRRVSARGCLPKGVYNPMTQRQTPPRPRGRHPHQTQRRTPFWDDHWSGWYASNWNSFLLAKVLRNNRLASFLLGLAPRLENPGSATACSLLCLHVYT